MILAIIFIMAIIVAITGFVCVDMNGLPKRLKRKPKHELLPPAEVARLERELLITPEARIDDIDKFIAETDRILNPPTEMEVLEAKVRSVYSVPSHRLVQTDNLGRPLYVQPMDQPYPVEIISPDRFLIESNYTRRTDLGPHVVEYHIQTDIKGECQSLMEQWLQARKNDPRLRILNMQRESSVIIPDEVVGNRYIVTYAVTVQLSVNNPWDRPRPSCDICGSKAFEVTQGYCECAVCGSLQRAV